MPRLAPYLQRRQDTLYFRIAVPPDLRQFVGSREITKTLKTSDRRTATHRALLLASQALQLFSELRAMPNIEKLTVLNPLIQGDGYISIGEGARAIGLSDDGLLNELRDHRAKLFTQGQHWQGFQVDDLDQIERDGDQFVLNSVEQVGHPCLLSRIAEAFNSAAVISDLISTGVARAEMFSLPGYGAFFPSDIVIEVPLSGWMAQKRAVACVRERLVAGLSLGKTNRASDAVARFERPLSLPPLPPQLTVEQSILSGQIAPVSEFRSAPAITLKTVIDKFLGAYQQDKKPAMFRKHQPVLSMLLDVIGDKPITELKQADINEFFELLGRMPPRWRDECRKRKLTIRELAELEFDITLGPKTFEDTYIASVRPFLKAAKKNYQDQGFPLGLTTEGTEYLGDREEDENKQRALDKKELERIFEGDEMLGFAKDVANHHRYWILHVALFTGARVNEICQINPQVDILQEEGSSDWYFLITDETESDPRVRKSVKTGDSRKVPIHKKLIEMGFLSYFLRIKSAGHKLLFPEWEPIRRRASGEAEKWVRQFFRDVQVRDETPKAKVLGMHAFRHTLLTYGAMQRPPLYLACITGHAAGDLPVPATGAAKGYFTLSMLNTVADGMTLLNQLDYGLSFHRPIVSGACAKSSGA